MTLIPIQIPWTQKPPVGTPIDWSNPLTKGLVGCWAFNESAGRTVLNAVDQGQSASMSSPISVNQNGLLVNATIAGNRVVTKDFIFGGNNPISVVAGAVQPTFTSSSTILCESTEIVLNTASSQGIQFILNSFSTNDRTSTSDSRIASGVNFFAAGTYDGSSLKAYSAPLGMSFISSSVTPTGTYANNTTPISLGGAPSSLASFNGTIFFIFLYNTCLLENELYQLNRNPWQIYQPQTIWIPAEAGTPAAFKAYWNRQQTRIFGGGLL